MQNKKLLSILCLAVLTGCQFSTSTSTNQPSSPASSSTVTPSSPVSSSTNEESSSSSVSSSSSSSSTVESSSSSSSSEDSTPVLPPETADDIITALAEKVNAGIDPEVYGDVTEMSFTQYSTATTTVTKNHSIYYSDAVVTTQTRGYSSTKNYKKVLDGRYYEVELDLYDEENPEVTSILGYEIVEDNATDSQLTQADVDKKLAFSSGLTNGFGYGLTLESLVNGIFTEYDSDLCYNISISKKYVSSSDYEGFVNAISYFYELSTPDMGNKLYQYSAEFAFADNGSLSKMSLCQKTYNALDYDFDNHELSITGAATGAYFFDYGFNYGEIKAEETPVFDISSNLFTDFDVKFYSNSSRTEEITSTQKGNGVYLSAVGTPAEAKDIIVLASCTDPALSSYIGRPVDDIYSYYPEQIGEVTFVFSSAAGISKTVTFTVEAVAPTSISLDYGQTVPSILANNSSISLPTCNINPYNADQNYEWKIVEGSDYATITEEYGMYTLNAIATGEVKVQANALGYENIATDIYTITIVEAKSEEELRTALTSSAWVLSRDGNLYSLTLTENGKGTINFGKEICGRDSNWNYIYADVDTTYTFDYVLNYADSSLEISNDTWNNRQADGDYARYTSTPAFTVELTGGSITATFSYDWYGSVYSDDFKFTPAYTKEEVKAAACATWSGGIDLGNWNNAYFYITLNSDNTGSIYLEGYDYVNYVPTEIGKTDFTYSWNDNNQIVINTLEGATFEYECEIQDPDTYEWIPATYSISIDNTVDVDQLLCSSLTLTYSFTCTNNSTGNGTFNVTKGY